MQIRKELYTILCEFYRVLYNTSHHFSGNYRWILGLSVKGAFDYELLKGSVSLWPVNGENRKTKYPPIVSRKFPSGEFFRRAAMR